MSAAADRAQVVKFGIFELDLRARELRRRGVRIRLQEQSFQVLSEFLARPGEVVTREELRQRLWANRVYGDFDHGLNNVLARLREVLGDSADDPRFIETLPKVGYRFIHPVAGPDSAIEATEPPNVAIAPEPRVESLPAASEKRIWRDHVSRRMLLTVMLIATLGGGGALWATLDHSPTAAANGAGPARSIAVVPFANLTTDAEVGMLADGYPTN